jgi:5-formyltetrahydrofolate cyclo-ligase
MNPELPEAKAALRAMVRERLKLVSPTHRVTESAQLCARLKASEIWRAAKSVLFFAPLPDEPDLWPLLEFALHEKKLAALPSYDAETNSYIARRIAEPLADLVAGKFGIREPAGHCAAVALNQLDLLLVPGVAFDSGGQRLGRGKGYYDRLLALTNGATCGVAYDEQIVPLVPAAPHDVKLNRILTPTRWF